MALAGRKLNRPVAILFGSLFVLASFLPAGTRVYAQGITGSAGSGATVESRYIVDMPTAGMLKKGQLSFDTEFFQDGGILFGFSFGLFDRFMIGLSYGGRQIIGSRPARFNPAPGIQLRLRLLEESVSLPAFILGFDNQGREPYVDSTSRYTIKSPGAFAAVSKNYSFLGTMSVHAGVNYSFERTDGAKDFNLYAGIEKSLGPVFSVSIEYNVGINDNGPRSIGKGKGYLNTYLGWSMGSGFTLGVGLKNLTRNQNDVRIGNRILRIEYVRDL